MVWYHTHVHFSVILVSTVAALDALALRIRFDVLVCGRGLLNLEEYSNINLTGFEKLLNRFQMYVKRTLHVFSCEGKSLTCSTNVKLAVCV